MGGKGQIDKRGLFISNISDSHIVNFNAVYELRDEQIISHDLAMN